MSVKYLLTLFFLGCISVKGQDIMPDIHNSAGGSAVVNGNIYDWSIGEMVLVSTASGSGIIVTQGLLQPKWQVDYAGGSLALDQLLDVYPVPSRDFISIRASMEQSGRLTCELQDMLGKRISSRIFELSPGTSVQQISMEGVANGNYMLRVSFLSQNKRTTLTSSYKIQKIN